MKWALPLALLASGLALPASAAARPDPFVLPGFDVPHPPVPVSDLTVRGGPGVFHDRSTNSSGAALGVLGLYRHGALEAGAAFDAGTLLFDLSYADVAAGAGLGWRTRDGARIDAVGVFGLDSYSGVGAGFIDNDPGASGTLPVAGARLVLSWELSHARLHPTFAIAGSFDHDLDKRWISYDYESNPWFYGPTLVHEERRIGSDRVALLLQFGMEYDLH